jgi:hypothetical protein
MCTHLNIATREQYSCMSFCNNVKKFRQYDSWAAICLCLNLVLIHKATNFHLCAPVSMCTI